jgi:4a-hydroxytetrahydrobiopterin dehydratase
MALADQQCIPCTGSVPPLEPAQADVLLEQLGGGWEFDSTGHLRFDYTFGNFAAALSFADRVGVIAELEGHHPDLHVAWGSCGVEIWTHKIDGLTESDFVLAAKIQRMADAGNPGGGSSG